MAPRNAHSLRVASRAVPFDDARAVVAGYCLGQEDHAWTAPTKGVGGTPGVLKRGAFAYKSYDSIPAAPGARIQGIDVLVANGLNAQMRAKDIAAVLMVADELSNEIEAIDINNAKFWQLNRRDLGMNPPDGSSTAWPLWRAWTLLMGLDGIDLARAHKILHHKRPTVFPLIDNKTVHYLNRSGSAWAAIHKDLTETADTWSRLETATTDMLESRGCIRLSRLRLHDILLWTYATDRWDAALRHGRPLIADQQ